MDKAAGVNRYLRGFRRKVRSRFVQIREHTCEILRLKKGRFLVVDLLRQRTGLRDAQGYYTIFGIEITGKDVDFASRDAVIEIAKSFLSMFGAVVRVWVNIGGPKLAFLFVVGVRGIQQ